MRNAYFAGGCFWCVTPIYKIYGVSDVICGYAGGDEENPTYEEVKHQKTSHRETIKLVYDPEDVDYSKLLDIYFYNVDPFDPDGQFIDKGFSYTLAIFYETEEEKCLALSKIAEIEEKAGKKVYVEVLPYKNFYEAEEYHQNYYLKNPEAFEKELIESGRKKETVIERVTTADTLDLLKIYAPYVTDTAITFEYDVPSFEEFKGRIEDISSKYPYIKAVQDGKTVGYAYATAFKGRRAYDWSVETTIYMDMNEKRKGVGRLLYNELEKLLKGMGVINMNACIALPKVEDRYLTNDSVKYHERMGFTEVGVFHSCAYKFDTWYDMIWMEKMIGEHKVPQEDVRFGQW